MKRAYESMAAYKISFNASEQVAAACQVSDTGSKYDMSGGSGAVIMCAENGKYGMGNSCVGTDESIAANIKYGN